MSMLIFYFKRIFYLLTKHNYQSKIKRKYEFHFGSKEISRQASKQTNKHKTIGKSKYPQHIIMHIFTEGGGEKHV